MDNEKFNTLLVGSDGAKGMYFLGAIFYLEQQKHLSHIEKYIGVSIGSITCLLLNCGYTSKELITIFIDFDTDYKKDFDLNACCKNLGIFSNTFLKDKLTLLIQKKFIDSDFDDNIPTLLQLYKFTKKEFYSCTHNKTINSTEFISYKNFPNIKCIDSVLLSANIPIMFYELKYNDCIYLDGVLSNPYPINFLDDGKNKIIGMYLNQLKTNIETVEQKTIKTISESICQYVVSIMDIPLNTLRDINISKCSERCINLAIPCNKIDTMGISLDIKDKAEMVMTGYNYTKNNLKIKKI